MGLNSATFTTASPGLNPLVMPADYDDGQDVDVEFFSEGARGTDLNGKGGGGGSYGKFAGVTLGDLAQCRINLATGVSNGQNTLTVEDGTVYGVSNGNVNGTAGLDISDEGADVFHPGGAGGPAGPTGGGGGGGGASATADGTPGDTGVGLSGTGHGGLFGGGNGGTAGANGQPGAPVGDVTAGGGGGGGIVGGAGGPGVKCRITYTVLESAASPTAPTAVPLGRRPGMKGRRR